MVLCIIHIAFLHIKVLKDLFSFNPDYTTRNVYVASKILAYMNICIIQVVLYTQRNNLQRLLDLVNVVGDDLFYVPKTSTNNL